MARYFSFLLVLITAFSFFSCADAEPELILATSSVVFDYADDAGLPQTRLAVFVQMDSEVQRAERLEMENRDTGYNWRVSAPRLFTNGDKKWACYTNLQPPAHVDLPAGVYDFRYIDAAGEEATSSFIVSYPSALLKTKSDEAAAFLSSIAENLALYDKNNVLVYFGKPRSNWTSNAAILRDFNAAVTKRRCLSSDNNRVVCMMPEESLFEVAAAKTEPEDDDFDDD